MSDVTAHASAPDIIANDSSGVMYSHSCPTSLTLIDPPPNKRHAAECGSLPIHHRDAADDRDAIDGSDRLVACKLDNKEVRMLPLYYGIWMPDEAREKDNAGVPLVIQNYNEVWELLKANKTYRFKTFHTIEAAQRFSLLSQAEVVSQVDHAAKLHTSNEAPAPVYFPTPKKFELENFARLLDTDNADEMHRLIWQNPRYLVSKEDNVVEHGSKTWGQTILAKAAKLNAHKCLRVILGAFRELKFYEMWYPTLEKNNLRILQRNILEMNLNGQQNRYGNTPLHCAVENGAVECVDLLMMHPYTDFTLPNKAGILATDEDLVCKACPGKIQVAHRIREMLRPRFIVPITIPASSTSMNGGSKRPRVVGAGEFDQNDQFSIHTPIPLREAYDLENRRVIAYMGPTADVHNAYKFFVDVKKAVNSAGGHQMRREDTLKGVERVARLLACENNLPWCEKWEFLEDRFTPLFDLQSPEALQKVEQHFAKMCKGEKSQRNASTSHATTPEAKFFSPLTKSHMLKSPLAASSPIPNGILPNNGEDSAKNSKIYVDSSPLSQRRLDFSAEADETTQKEPNSTDSGENLQNSSMFETMQDISGHFDKLAIDKKPNFAEIESKFENCMQISGGKKAEFARLVLDERISNRLSTQLNLSDAGEERHRTIERYFTPPTSPRDSVADFDAEMNDDDDDLPFYDADADPSLLLDDDYSSIESSFVLGGDEASDVDRSLYYALTDNVNSSTTRILSKAKTYPYMVSWMSRVERVEKLSPSPNRLQSSGIVYDMKRRDSFDVDGRRSSLQSQPKSPLASTFSPFSIKRFPPTNPTAMYGNNSDAGGAAATSGSDEYRSNMLWGLAVTPPRKPSGSMSSSKSQPVAKK